jgi:drug/metabolite transporter (DMT)-like permease
MILWLAFLAALFATMGNNIGKVLQKRGTQDLPRFALSWGVLCLYVRNRHWLLGFMGDCIGAVLTVVALALAPVSTVQPILASGAIFLVVFSHYYLGEQMKAPEWWGVVLAVIGAIGIGLTMEPSQDKLQLDAALWVLLIAGALVVLCELLYRRGLWIELSAGLQAGFGFGLSAVVMRTGLLLAQQYNQWLWAFLGLGGSILLTSTGFYCQTRGLKDGRASTIGIYTSVFALVVAVAAGIFALNEPMPTDILAWYARMTSFCLISLGAVLMARRCCT